MHANTDSALEPTQIIKQRTDSAYKKHTDVARVSECSGTTNHKYTANSANNLIVTAMVMPCLALEQSIAMVNNVLRHTFIYR